MGRRIVIGLVIVSAVALVVAVVLAIASTSWLESFGAKPKGDRLERIRASPHHRDGTFQNLVPTNKLVPGTFWSMLRRQLFGDEERVPRRPIPVVARTAADYAAPPALRATWIGHATALIEIDGHRVLTDPIWSDRCSPSRWLGPKRFHAAPIALADLPAIEVVVISHDHYDHLDMATVKTLAARGSRFAVPLGIGAHLEAWGVPEAQISELDWYQSAAVGGLQITATPARHYSGRNPLRADVTLWASWVVKGPQHAFFFSGDSGYFDELQKIGAKLGPFDLALVKIGACDVTWQDIHMSPEEAVLTARDVRGKLLLPVHWGTFNLAFHAWNEPAERVVAAAKRDGVPLVVPRPGQLVEPTKVVEDTSEPDPWWR